MASQPTLPSQLCTGTTQAPVSKLPVPHSYLLPLALSPTHYQCHHLCTTNTLEVLGTTYITRHPSPTYHHSSPHRFTSTVTSISLRLWYLLPLASRPTGHHSSCPPLPLAPQPNSTTQWCTTISASLLTPYFLPTPLTTFPYQPNLYHSIPPLLYNFSGSSHCGIATIYNHPMLSSQPHKPMTTLPTILGTASKTLGTNYDNTPAHRAVDDASPLGKTKEKVSASFGLRNIGVELGIRFGF
ncbi:outer membrane protein 3 [Anaplasma marginale str. Florida]|uniref:Outer membrane protein 3 n=1 Tax=Anaplasma marginale (strain Florida) TaxID=320483 RepID=B9KGZ8_ANAMF|nr:outer membrane protein 3 [Anaplasma marginale str. Florida]